MALNPISSREMVQRLLQKRREAAELAERLAAGVVTKLPDEPDRNWTRHRTHTFEGGAVLIRGTPKILGLGDGDWGFMTKRLPQAKTTKTAPYFWNAKNPRVRRK